MSWIGLTLIAIAGVLGASSRGGLVDKEPRYQGRRLTDLAQLYMEETGVDPLSMRSLYSGRITEGRDPVHEFLNRMRAPDELPPRAEEARQAILRIGTNALPWILKHLAYQPPQWKERANDLAYRFTSDGDSEGTVIFNFQEKETQAQSALMALEILGAEAAAAIPELVAMAASTNRSMVARRALRGLVSMGIQAVGPLIMVITNGNAALREEAMVFLGIGFRMDTNALPAVPIFLTYLTNGPSSAQAWAAAALGSLGLDPELIVPALTNCLTTSDTHLRRAAAMALFRFGPTAREALPILAAIPDNGDWLFRAARAKWMRQLND